MTTVHIELQGQELEDGRVFITSKTLDGFYLMVQPGENVELEVQSALKVYYPLYASQKARLQADLRRP